MKKHDGKTSLKSKILIFVLTIMSAFGCSLTAANEARAASYGEMLENAARVAMVTRMMQFCFYKSNSSKDYATTGWSLFSRLDSSEHKFRGGAWIESQVGEKGEVSDGEVYCGESQNEYSNLGRRGSDIIRLFSKYMFGDDNKDTIHNKLFCNKYIPGYSGITRLSYDSSGTRTNDEYGSCGDFEDTYHFVISSADSKVLPDGRQLNVGTLYIKQLYEEYKREKNQFLPEWDDLVGDARAGKSKVFDDQYDTSGKYAYLRYYWALDEFEAAGCAGSRLKGNGKGDFTLSLVDSTTGEITQTGYYKGPNYKKFMGADFWSWDYEIDADWDHSYEAADNPADAGEDDWGCLSYHQEIIPTNAKHASAKIKELYGNYTETVSNNFIDQCVSNSKILLNKTKSLLFANEGSTKGAITKISMRAQNFLDVYSAIDNYVNSRQRLLGYLTYGDDAKTALVEARSDPDVKLTFEENSFVSQFVEQLYQAQEAVKQILYGQVDELSDDATMEDLMHTTKQGGAGGGLSDPLSEEEQLQIKKILGVLKESECATIQATGGECNVNGLAQAKEEFDKKANTVKNWVDGRNSIVSEQGCDHWVYYSTEAKSCDGNKFYDPNGQENLYSIDKNDPNNEEKSKCIFTESYFPNGLAEQLGTKLESNVNIDWDYLKKKAEELAPDEVDDTDDWNSDGATYEADYCYTNGGSLSWVLCPALSAMGSIGQHMYDQIEQNHLKIQANAMFNSDSGLSVAWENIRNYVNIGFVIFLFIIILSQLTGFGIDNYGIKRMLPKFLVAIVLVNLSFIIMQIAVDLSNILGMSFNNMLSGLAGKIQVKNEIAYGGATLSDYMKAGGGIIGFLLLGGAAGLIAVYKTSVKTGSSLLGGLILLLVMIVVIVVVAMLTLYLTLVAREVGIIFVIVVAPAALLCRILPNTEKLYKKWFEMAKGLLLLYPICGLTIGMGRLGSSILVGIADNMENGTSMYTAAAIVQVISFFFIPTLLKQSMAAMGNIGSKIMGLGNRLGRSAARDAAGFIGSRDRFKKWDKNRQEDWKNRKELRGISRDARKAYRREHGVSKDNMDKYIGIKAKQDKNLQLSEDEIKFMGKYGKKVNAADERNREETEAFNSYKGAMQRMAEGEATAEDYKTIRDNRKLAFDRSQRVADQKQATDAYKAAAQTGFFSMAGARQSMTQQINSQVQKEEQSMYADQASLMSRSELMGRVGADGKIQTAGALQKALEDHDTNKVIAYMQAAASRGYEKECDAIFNNLERKTLEGFNATDRQSIFAQAAAFKDIGMKAWGKNMGKMSEREVDLLDDSGNPVLDEEGKPIKVTGDFLTPQEFNSGTRNGVATDLNLADYLKQKGAHVLDGQTDDSIDNITNLVKSGSLKLDIETVINGMNSTTDGKELKAFNGLASALEGIGEYKMSATQAAQLNTDSFQHLVGNFDATGAFSGYPTVTAAQATQVDNMLSTFAQMLSNKNTRSRANQEMVAEFRGYLEKAYNDLGKSFAIEFQNKLDEINNKSGGGTP